MARKIEQLEAPPALPGSLEVVDGLSLHLLPPVTHAPANRRVNKGGAGGGKPRIIARKKRGV